MGYRRTEILRLAAQAAAGVGGLLGAARPAERPVERFLAGYVRQHKRPGLVASAPHRAELVEALERECLLLLTRRIDALLRRRLAIPGARKRARDAGIADLFLEEFLAHLTRARGWDAGAIYEFRRDLAIYVELSEPLTSAARTRPRKLGERPAGPFVDRCALLLDPSLFDKSRAAAARLAAELEAQADALLARLLRRRSR